MDRTRYKDEEQFLEKTVAFIDKEIERLKAWRPARAPHTPTADKLQKITDDKLELYENVRPQPYFGRIDFLEDGRERPEKRCIGKGLVDRHVISWESPLAKQLYYAEPKKVDGYDVARSRVRGGPKRVKGGITLKRHYDIEEAKLLGVNEVYQLLPPSDGRREAKDSSQEFMVQQLARSRGGRLKETVATIQPEQYQQIAAAPETVMIVQGVAGSGKSIVGLHRIAYLVSPFNEQSWKIEASRVVFFGPTRTFIDYVRGLLPSINVRDVNHQTVSGWLQSTLTARVFLDRRESLLEKLLKDRGKNWQEAYEAAKIKGSLEMSRIMKRYVRNERKRFGDAATALAVRFDSALPIVIEARQVRGSLESLPDGPLNGSRRGLIDRLVQSSWDEYVLRNKRLTGETLRSRRSNFIARVRPQIEQQVSTFWRVLDFRQEYRRLLSDVRLLGRASRGSMGSRQSAVLHSSLPRRPNVFALEDLGPLCYLDHLLNDHASAAFQHVVLDEAQEISPMELLVIQRHTRANAFTILGDLTQSLSPQGIDRWQEALRLFRGEPVIRYRVRRIYRATRQITGFANRLLKQVSPKAVTAIPFDRHGPRPSFNRARDYKEMVSAIAGDVEQLQTRGMTTVGILCKTGVDARKLHAALRKSGVARIGLIERDKSSSENIVIAPISLTRGLEFDAVIVASAGKENYPSTPLHGRILYLAVTRAAHELRIHWVGQPAPQLPIPKTRRLGKATKKKKSRRKLPSRAAASRNSSD